MVIAGIDEAGYGPLLGPLVVGCAAFEIQTDAAPDAPPCLWKRLSRLVSKSPSKTGRKLHINDSKLVYNPGLGLKELERSLLAVAAATGDLPADLAAVLARFAPDALPHLAPHPWYAPCTDEKFPIEVESASARIFGSSLRDEMRLTQTQCLYLRACVVPEGQFNHMVAATRNKAAVSFTFVAQHIDYLLRNFAQRGLVLYCDRQGGREHYGRLLQTMFEQWALEVTKEEDGYAEYRLQRSPSPCTQGEGRGEGPAPMPVRIVFCEEAEKQCLPVALASMLSKYLREALMRRFNAWWSAHLPGLTPTAGYYNDGLRFLADVQAKRTELGIADAELVRAR